MGVQRLTRSTLSVAQHRDVGAGWLTNLANIFRQRHWLPRIGEILILTCIALALLLLQVSIVGKGLLHSLPSYGLVALAALLAYVVNRAPSRANIVCLAATAGFCGYIALRAITSPTGYYARADLYLVLAALVVYGLTVTILSSASKRLILICALLAMAVCYVFAGLAQFWRGENFMGVPPLHGFEVTQRASGLYRNPDHLSGLLEVLGIFGLSITCWSRLPKWAKVATGYLTLICYVGVALTGSRGGYLSVVVSLLVFATLSFMMLRSAEKQVLRKYAAIGLIVVAAVLLGGGALMLQDSSLRKRVAQVVTPDSTRFDLWRASIEQWKLQPVFGTGSASYRFYGRQFRAERMQADPVVVHNDYLHLLCEYGLVGVAAFGIFIWAHLRQGWHSFVRYGPRRVTTEHLPFGNHLALTLGALGAIAAYAMHSVVDFNLHVPANALLVAFVIGLLAESGNRAGAAGARVPAILVVISFVLLVQCTRLLPGEYFAEQARVALEGENPEAAVVLAHKALGYEPRNPNIYFYLARALAALGNEKQFAQKRAAYYDSSLAAFNQARKLAPLDGSYPLDMGYAFDQLGRFSEAEWMYGLALARDPRSVNVQHLYKTHISLWSKEGRQTLADSADPAAPVQN